MKRVLFSGSALGVTLLGALLYFKEDATPVVAPLTAFAHNQTALLDFKALSNAEKGFLQTGAKRFTESDLFLQKALSETIIEQEIQEIVLAKAINAFFEGKGTEFCRFVENAKKRDPAHPELSLFEALSCYLKKDYSHAIALFQKSLNEKKGEGWIQELNSQFFPRNLKIGYLAHALIEKKEFRVARDLLEREGESAATALVALSYLREAKDADLQEQEPLYKMALYLLEKESEPSSFIGKTLLATMQSEIVTLLENQEELAKPFIKLLCKWEEQEVLDHLATTVAGKILKGGVVPENLDRNFNELVAEKLSLCLTLAIKEKKKIDIENLWDQIALLSNHETLTIPVLAATKEEILRSIYRDDEDLSQTQPLFKFWQQLEKDKRGRQSFFAQLVERAKLLWKTDGEEKKGTTLIATCLEKCDDKCKEDLLYDVEEFFGHLYKEAERANMVGRLSLIHDALKHLEIDFHRAPSKVALANYLADAAYLFESHNYSSALTHAEWVLKLDPENEEALYLVGLSSYHTGNYDAAIASLKKLSNPNVYAQKALMLSEVCTAAAQEKHLAHRETLDDLEEDK